MGISLTQLVHLRILVSEYVSAQLALAKALRAGSKEDVLEADKNARKAVEAYLKFTDSLLQKDLDAP